MEILRKHSSTSNLIRCMLRSSIDGSPLTGLDTSSPGLIISTIADVEPAATVYTGGNLETIGTLGTFTTPTASKCRFMEVDDTNHPGLYEVQLANARFAVASARVLHVSITGATNLLTKSIIIQLTTVDVDNANAGLTNLDAAVTSRMATFTLPTNFSTLSIDGSGLVDITQAAADKAWGTTARQLTGTQTFNLTGSITGSLSGSVGSVTAGVTVTTNNDKTGYSLTVTPPTAAQVRTEMDSNSTQLAAILADTAELTGANAVETGVSLLQAQRAFLAALAGVVTGGGTATITLKDPSGSSTRVILAVDTDGNRTSSTLSL